LQFHQDAPIKIVLKKLIAGQKGEEARELTANLLSRLEKIKQQLPE